MPMLNLIEDRFNNLSLKSQIELFLLPLLVLVLIWNLFFNNINTIKNLKQKNLSLNFLQMRSNIIDIINDIRVFSLKNEIKIESLEGKEKNINLKIKGSFKKQLNFINYIENYNSFSNINYMKQEKNYLELNITFENIFIKKKNKVLNSFVLESKDKKNKKVDLSQFKLEAIVGEKAFLNKKWLAQNQSVNNNYKLTKVHKNYILLSDGIVKLKIELYKDDGN